MIFYAVIVYLISLFLVYGIVAKILNAYHGEDHVLVVVLTFIWPVWLLFYFSYVWWTE